jgi:hypothetical protein
MQMWAAASRRVRHLPSVRCTTRSKRLMAIWGESAPTGSIIPLPRECLTEAGTGSRSTTARPVCLECPKVRPYRRAFFLTDSRTTKRPTSTSNRSGMATSLR